MSDLRITIDGDDDGSTNVGMPTREDAKERTQAVDERARAAYREIEAAQHELLQAKRDEVAAALQNVEAQEAAAVTALRQANEAYDPDAMTRNQRTIAELTVRRS
jgi:BRCT domain type II-containing protein